IPRTCCAISRSPKNAKSGRTCCSCWKNSARPFPKNSVAIFSHASETLFAGVVADRDFELRRRGVTFRRVSARLHLFSDAGAGNRTAARRRTTATAPVARFHRRAHRLDDAERGRSKSHRRFSRKRGIRLAPELLRGGFCIARFG